MELVDGSNGSQFNPNPGLINLEYKFNHPLLIDI